MQKPQTIYRGRFAPSPSGPLHFGSLLAATASYLQARKMNGEWWLRIEDIDPPRELKGASKHIIQTLRDYGFVWDNLSYQSQRLNIYSRYINNLLEDKQAYYCGCSRQEIYQQNTKTEQSLALYPGTCRNGLKGKTARSIRTKLLQATITIEDAIQGKQSIDLCKTTGDFVIKRADGFFSYQLAVALDDSLQRMTQIVRGYDLHESSFCQRYLCQQLQLNSPDYAHIPVAVNAQGNKLSKQTAASDIAAEIPEVMLWFALEYLGQHPPKRFKSLNLRQLWQWAIDNWDLQKIPGSQSINSPV